MGLCDVEPVEHDPSLANAARVRRVRRDVFGPYARFDAVRNGLMQARGVDLSRPRGSLVVGRQCANAFLRGRRIVCPADALACANRTRANGLDAATAQSLMLQARHAMQGNQQEANCSRVNY